LRTDQGRGVWVDSAVGQVPFGEYATTWLSLREIRPRTCELYTSLLANHLRPTFGDIALAKITPLAVRAWRAERLSVGIVASCSSRRGGSDASLPRPPAPAGHAGRDDRCDDSGADGEDGPRVPRTALI
jgi:hypothetical protein